MPDDFIVHVTNEQTEVVLVTEGARGERGEKGDAATITVGVVSTGAPGSNATVINAGSQNAAVFDISIPRGNQGIKGDKGDTPEVTIGTVVTGAPGSNATVTNVGTLGDSVFNFSIPRGDKGAKGDSGNDGINGSSTPKPMVVTPSGMHTPTVPGASFVSPSFDAITLIPWWVSEDVSIESLGLWGATVTTGAGVSLHQAIYQSLPSGLPDLVGGVVLPPVAIPITTGVASAFKDAAYPASLTAGLHWVASAYSYATAPSSSPQFLPGASQVEVILPSPVLSSPSNGVGFRVDGTSFDFTSYPTLLALPLGLASYVVLSKP